METRFPSLFESSRTALLAAFALSALAACSGGGGTGGTGTTTPPPGAGGPTISSGVMTKGSTIVNGVRFEDTTANISLDDTPKTNAALQNGMVVKVAGTVNDDGINGTAQRVKAVVEARGKASLPAPTNPQSLVLNNQTVFVDDQTVFSGVANFGGITNGMLVEVYGLRDDSGRIRATRIETQTAQMADSTLDEIRGAVTGGAAGANPATFSIGAQPINAASAAIVPTGATYQNGSIVEVYCTQPCLLGGVFQATRLKVEDAQDDAFKPASGQKAEVEGLISGFGGHPGDFSVGTTPVTTTSSTRFEGGIASDLANNAKVEAEGSWNGTRLVANKIEFKRSVVRVQGSVAAGGAQFTMNVAGHSVTIKTDSQTSGSVPAVFSGCVQVRGQRAVPATPLVVLAGEISTSCSNGGRPFMQAPVEAESGTTLTLLGFPVDVATANDNPPFENIDGSPMTQAAFLDAVTPATTNAAGVSVPGTLVKVIFETNAVKQAELED
jgi:uncharacterized protein DUF5666